MNESIIKNIFCFRQRATESSLLFFFLVGLPVFFFAQRVTESAKFKGILEITLALGNFVNSGHQVLE